MGHFSYELERVVKRMKKKARIIISNSTGDQLSDALVEQMLIRTIFSDGGVTPLDGIDVDDIAEYDNMLGALENRNNSEDRSKTVVSVIGELEEQDGVVNIRYMESELTDMAGVETLISFSDPDEVTMVRTGMVSTALCFNKALERRVCWYNEIMFPIDISVITDRFKNTVSGTRGGVLDVVYSVEMKGLPMETSHLTVQVKPL